MTLYSDLTTMPVSPADHRIAYGPGPLQFGDLRLPIGDGPVPLVILVHGGCWRAQYDLKHIAPAAAAITSAGFATWAIEYSRIGDPNGGWPGTFDDVSHAIDHVRAIARQFPRIDTTRVVLVGHSAGGQLALWAASRRQNENTGLFRSSITPLRLAGVVSLAGISDLATYGAQPGGCNAEVTPLMGGTPKQVAGRYHAVSPVDRVPIGTPIRLIHGEADPIVPPAQSKDFLARARIGGDVVQMDLIPNAGHFDLIAPQSGAWVVVMRSINALGGVKKHTEPQPHVG
jgi:acetyl esterase/lipase